VALTVHDYVDPLVEERGEAADLGRVMQRLLVGPGDVGDDPAADGDRPVRRLPLIGAVGPGVAGTQFGAEVLAGQ
jgi:hypothetical protein